MGSDAQRGPGSGPFESERPEAYVVEYFLRLVDRGRHRGCSAAERHCRELAALIVRFVPHLDGQAIAGLHDWIDFAKRFPAGAQDYVLRRP